jgi:hypothetical protein
MIALKKPYRGEGFCSSSTPSGALNAVMSSERKKEAAGKIPYLSLFRGIECKRLLISGGPFFPLTGYAHVQFGRRKSCTGRHILHRTIDLISRGDF